MPFEGAESMDTNNIAFAAASEWQAVGHQRGLDLYTRLWFHIKTTVHLVV